MDTTTSTEHLDTVHVEDALTVAMSKLKKSKWASHRSATKRGILVDDETCSPPILKPNIENDGSDNVVESSDMPQTPQDSTTNVPGAKTGDPDEISA